MKAGRVLKKRASKKKVLRKKAAKRKPAKKKATKKKAGRKRGKKASKVERVVIEEPGKMDEPAPPQEFSPEFVAQQFKPGQSGNPSGRAKGHRTLKGWIQLILNTESVETQDGKTMSKGEALARRLVNGALRANVDRQFMEIVSSREYPKPTIHDIKLPDPPDTTARDVVATLDAAGRDALAEVVKQLGATSALDDSMAGEDEQVH